MKTTHPNPSTLKPQVPSGVSWEEEFDEKCWQPVQLGGFIQLIGDEAVDHMDFNEVKQFIRDTLKSHLQAEVEEILTKVETEYAKFYKKKAREYGIKRGVPYTAFHKIIDELESRLTKQPPKRGKQEG